ncbi:MAG: cell division protein ZapA [Bdellovibrionales bacterium]|nr:cell division protein ZapA [Bdellovibrionales bacterium]
MGTEVKILGKTYQVKSQYDPEFTGETADMVNMKMGELMGKAHAISTEKIAILTAMNIAGDFLKYRRVERKRRKLLQERIDHLVQIIEEKENELKGEGH